MLFPVVYRQHVSAVMRDPGHLQALEFRSNNQMHKSVTAGSCDSEALRREIQGLNVIGNWNGANSFILYTDC